MRRGERGVVGGGCVIFYLPRIKQVVRPNNRRGSGVVALAERVLSYSRGRHIHVRFLIFRELDYIDIQFVALDGQHTEIVLR